VPPSSQRDLRAAPAVPFQQAQQHQPQNGFVLQALASAPQNEQIREAEARLFALRRDLESVEEAFEIQSFGFYRPKYGFDNSEIYAAKLKQLRDQQKHLIKSGGATHCDTPWVFGGSAAEGKKMIDRMAKLMLRAFNGECDAAIAKARYDNVVSLEQRVTKSCEEINKLGHSNRICVTTPYYQMKLAELHLVHEHREKVQEEKEVQKRIREDLKEELKAREEAERAQADAERDEEKKRTALEKAQADLAATVGTAAQHAKLESLVARLETELRGALDVKAKAIARAADQVRSRLRALEPRIVRRGNLQNRAHAAPRPLRARRGTRRRVGAILLRCPRDHLCRGRAGP